MTRNSRKGNGILWIVCILGCTVVPLVIAYMATLILQLDIHSQLGGMVMFGLYLALTGLMVGPGLKSIFHLDQAISLKKETQNSFYDCWKVTK